MKRTPLAAELRILRSRKPTWAVLFLSLLAGIIVPAVIVLIHQQAGPENPQPVVQFLAQTAADACGRALWVSNLYLIPLLLLLLSCTSIATERSSQRLRDFAVQPLSRNNLLKARVLSHAILAAGCATLTFVPAIVIGLIYFPESGDMASIGGAYVLSCISNIVLMGIGMVLSTYLQSAGFAAISTIIMLVFEQIFRALLQLSKSIFGFSVPDSVVYFLPGHALDAWNGWTNGWEPTALAGLLFLAVLTYGLLFRRFQKLHL